MLGGKSAVPAPPRGAPPASFFGAGRPPPMVGRPPMMGGARPRGPPVSATAGAKFGTLKVTIHSAKDLTPIDGAASSVLDSLVVVRVGQTEEATPVCVKGGTVPSYNAILEFVIRSEREIDFSVFFRRGASKGGFDDACVGRGRANFMPWIAQGQFMGPVELKDDKGQPAGSVIISAKFERTAIPSLTSRSAELPSNAPAGAVTKPLAGTVATKPAAATGGGGSTPASKFTDKEIRDAFTSFDLDKNDFVGAAEIRHVLVNIGENVTDEEIDEMIRMCDRDGDGQVSFDEFYRMVTGGREPPSANAMAAASGSGDNAMNATMVAQRNAKKTALQNFVADFSISQEVLQRMAIKVKRQGKGDGTNVDYSEFCDICGTDPSPVLEKIFKMFDVDKVKQIDSREFIISLANFAPASKEEKVKFAFTMFDINNDGTISKDELIKILRANHMAGSDKEVAKKAETIMTQADADNDGVVSWDEFQIVAKRFPNILFPSTLTK